MKIKTTPWFKIRGLAFYTRRLIPTQAMIRRDRLLSIKWKLFSRERMEREIFNSCIILKNLAMVRRDMPMSADFILEQLMESSHFLRSIYADILSAYRTDGSEKAFQILSERVPLKSAKNFSMVLSRIDQINPAEMIGHMAAFEETLLAERLTKGMTRAEKKSMLMTMAAAITVFAILLNFTVVVVFMDALRALEQIF